MGLGNTSTGKVTFVNLRRGEFVTKDQSTNTLTGYIKGIEIVQDEYQGAKYDKLNITVVDGETFLLGIKMDSGYGRCFMQCLKNVDFNYMVEMQASYKEENGKKETSLFLKQKGHALKWYWSSKSGNTGLPPLKDVEFKGKTVKDNTDQMNFFKELIKGEISQRISEASVNPPAAAKSTEGPKSLVEDEDTDSLPF